MPQQGRISTPAQLEAARATRRELERQIESTSERRNSLVQQRHNADATGNAAIVREHDVQIGQLGGRIRTLEQQMLQVDDAIMEAVRRGVGSEQPGVPGVPAPAPPALPAPPGAEFTTVPPPFERAPTWLEENGGRILGFNAVVLLLIGVFAWRAIRRAGRQASPANIQVEKLSQAVDAIAVEVERISENQRYVTKIINERMLGEGSAQPVQSSAKDRVDAR